MAKRGYGERGCGCSVALQLGLKQTKSRPSGEFGWVLTRWAMSHLAVVGRTSHNQQSVALRVDYTAHLRHPEPRFLRYRAVLEQQSNNVDSSPFPSLPDHVLRMRQPLPPTALPSPTKHELVLK